MLPFWSLHCIQIHNCDASSLHQSSCFTQHKPLFRGLQECPFVYASTALIPLIVHALGGLDSSGWKTRVAVSTWLCRRLRRYYAMIFCVTHQDGSQPSNRVTSFEAAVCEYKSRTCMIPRRGPYWRYSSPTLVEPVYRRWNYSSAASKKILLRYLGGAFPAICSAFHSACDSAFAWRWDKIVLTKWVTSFEGWSAQPCLFQLLAFFFNECSWESDQRCYLCLEYIAGTMTRAIIWSEAQFLFRDRERVVMSDENDTCNGSSAKAL